MSNKELCERYIRILKAHPLTDPDRLNSIVVGKVLDFKTMTELSNYFDILDKRDERNSKKQIINKYNLNQLSKDWDEELSKLDEQGLNEFLGIDKKDLH